MNAPASIWPSTRPVPPPSPSSFFCLFFFLRCLAKSGFLYLHRPPPPNLCFRVELGKRKIGALGRCDQRCCVVGRSVSWRRSCCFRQVNGVHFHSRVIGETQRSIESLGCSLEERGCFFSVVFHRFLKYFRIWCKRKLISQSLLSQHLVL
jgi:hypothetical protein